MALEKGRGAFDALPAWANSSVHSLDDLYGPDDMIKQGGIN
jgi:hypothetical protein